MKTLPLSPNDRMPKSSADRPITSPEERDFFDSWLAHVEAGRIGTPTKMSAKELRTQVRNELLLCGRVY